MHLRKSARILSGAAVVAALTVAGTGIAAATSNAGPQSPASTGSPQPPGPHTRAPLAVSAASLCQNLWAVVNSDATLARAGCPNTTSEALGGGAFQVTFPRDITGCAFVATLGLSSFSGISPPGEVTVAGRSGTTNAVFIETSDSTGTPTPLGFHVSVQCGPSHRHGKVNLPAGNAVVTVSVPGGLSSASVALATVQNNVGVFVQCVTPNTSAGTITIRLNKAASKKVTVGWSVVD